jgi:endonuclease YncB( thermonuclease family)
MNASKWTGLWFLAAGFAAPAFADPCEAKVPSRLGDTFSGDVRYVGDGDSLCVGKTADPKEWIEVRLLDFDAPETNKKDQRAQALVATGILERIALGKAISCKVGKGRIGRTTTHDRVFGQCTIAGVGVGDLMREAGAPTGGN